MVDDVHVDRHPLVLGEQVGNADWRGRSALLRAVGSVQILT
jgi:hypothetical protein